MLPGPHKRYEESRETIRVLNEAVLSRETLRMHYRTGRTGEETERDFDPYRVWYRAGGLYAIGLDHRSGEIRTFAVDRIRALDGTGRHFEVAPDFDFDRHTASAFGVVSEPAALVKIRFDRRWRTHVEERVWHPTQKLEPLEDGGVQLSMEVGGVSELRDWVLSFGSGAEVLSPEALRTAVRQELEAAAARYAQPG